MRHSKRPLKKLRWRTRALLNLVCIALAALLIYAGKGFPYLNWEQDLHYSLRRSLADGAEIIFTQRVPDGLGTWGDEAEETVYLVRQGDSVGAMRMMRQRVGNTVFGGPNRYVLRYQNRGGLYIIPLYGAMPDDHFFRGVTVAVVPADPAVERVEVLYSSEPGEGEPSIHQAEQTEEGVFLSTVPADSGDGFLSFGVYDDLRVYNCLGAVGYDKDGRVVAQAQSAWGEAKNEN